MAVAEYAEEKFGNEKLFIPGLDTVPVSGATINSADVFALVDVALSGWYTEHKECAKFSRALCNYLFKKFCTLSNSGSSSSLLAISACDETYQSGEYILTCATGFPTTVAPIYQIGKKPIYVDIDPETLSPSMEDIQRALELYGKDIGGIILAHTLGFPFNEKELWDMKFGKWFVADCCDALGAKILIDGDWIPVGRYANALTLSFFPAHQITAGEGGAVLTDDDELHRVIESYSNWGRSCYCLPGQANTCGKRFEWETDQLPDGYDHKYVFDRLGYNLKMTEFQAALGNSQLNRFDLMLKKRRDNFGYLRSLLDPFEEYLQFVKVPDWTKPSPFGFPITVRDRKYFGATELIAHLENLKVATRRVFGGSLTKQPAFANLPYQRVSDLGGSESVMNNTFWIGCHDALRKEHLDYVVEIFWDLFRQRGLI